MAIEPNMPSSRLDISYEKVGIVLFIPHAAIFRVDDVLILVN